MTVDFKRLEKLRGGSHVRIVLPKNQIDKLKWKPGQYVKIFRTGKIIHIMRVEND